MRGRILVLLAAAAGVVLLVAGPATASDGCPPPKHPPHEYPPQKPMLSLSAGTITIGDKVTLTGTGFRPGESVEICFTAASAKSRCKGFTVTADQNGDFTKVITPERVGQVSITATGLSSCRTASVVLTVLPVGGPLPETGNAGWSLLRTGWAAIGVGAVLLLLTTVAWRRRDRRGAGV